MTKKEKDDEISAIIPQGGKDELCELAFHTGIVLGVLSRPQMQRTLLDKGLANHDFRELKMMLMKLAKVFYK